MSDFLFSGWETVGRTVGIGILAYVGVVFLLRVSGRRTLSKMNAFDFVVTVAIGSTLATILLNKNVALAEGITAFAVLTGLQFAVTWTSVRVVWFRRIVTGEPRLLLLHGEFLRTAMRRARVAEDEIHAALRSKGLGDPSQAAAVVIETDGSFSVIPANDHTGHDSLARIRRKR